MVGLLANMFDARLTGWLASWLAGPLPCKLAGWWTDWLYAWLAS